MRASSYQLIAGRSIGLQSSDCQAWSSLAGPRQIRKPRARVTHKDTSYPTEKDWLPETNKKHGLLFAYVATSVEIAL